MTGLPTGGESAMQLLLVRGRLLIALATTLGLAVDGAECSTLHPIGLHIGSNEVAALRCFFFIRIVETIIGVVIIAEDEVKLFVLELLRR
jgi:hypothetical protein